MKYYNTNYRAGDTRTTHTRHYYIIKRVLDLLACMFPSLNDRMSISNVNREFLTNSRRYRQMATKKEVTPASVYGALFSNEKIKEAPPRFVLFLHACGHVILKGLLRILRV